MCTAIITPKKLSGTITAPPSKSESHRAIICAALADGNSEIQNVSLSNDVLATINAVKVLGARVTFVENKIIINGSPCFATNFAKINPSFIFLKISLLSGTIGNLVLRPSSSANKLLMYLQ